MMNTFEQIIEIVRMNQKPYLDLFIRKGFATVELIGRYDCPDCEESLSEAEKTEKAIEWLSAYSSYFPDNANFVLYLKTHAKAPDKARFGPYDFSKGYEPGKLPAQPENNQNSLSGFPDVSKAGFIHEGKLEAELLKLKLKHAEEKKDWEFEKYKAEMDAKFELLKDTQNSWSPEKLNSIAEHVVDLAGMVFNKETKTSLAGTKEKANEQKATDEPDLKLIAVNEFAEQLYKSKSLADIEKIKNLVNKPEKQESE